MNLQIEEYGEPERSALNVERLDAEEFLLLRDLKDVKIREHYTLFPYLIFVPMGFAIEVFNKATLKMSGPTSVP